MDHRHPRRSRHGPQPPPPAAGGTHPFSLADPTRVRIILEAAGFAAIDLEPVEEPMVFGTNADDAYGFLQTMGIVEWVTHDLDPADHAGALGKLGSTV